MANFHAWTENQYPQSLEPHSEDANDQDSNLPELASTPVAIQRPRPAPNAPTPSISTHQQLRQSLPTFGGLETNEEEDSDADITHLMSIDPFSAYFLHTLPILPLTSLPTDQHSCTICQEPYAQQTHPELIVRLPCNHTFGRTCLSHWLASDNENSDTCPMCRAILFDHPHRSPDPIIEARVPPPARQRIIRRTPADVTQELTRFVQENTLREALDHNLSPTSAVRRAQNQFAAMHEATRHLSLNLTRDALVRVGMSGVRSDHYTERTAVEILAQYRRLNSRPTWPMIHVDELSRFEHLANQIEGARRRLAPAMSEMGYVPLWRHHGPGVCTLVNPGMRELVEEFLVEMVEVEGVVGGGRGGRD